MINSQISRCMLLLTACTLASCSDQPASTTATTATPAASPSSSPSSSPSPAITYNNTITIREIMSSLIDPHADALWNSVRVVSDADGITEYVPETEEDWASLRISAISIIEGANALMVPGRRVAPPGATGEFPEYEFTPEEVDELLAEDRESWNGFTRNLQDAAFDMLGAIDNRNADGVSEYGARLDEACESCHAVYWYREGI